MGDGGCCYGCIVYEIIQMGVLVVNVHGTIQIMVLEDVYEIIRMVVLVVNVYEAIRMQFLAVDAYGM